MERRTLGHTDLVVSRLGLGCGALGDISAYDAQRLVEGALALGINLFDTAPSYSGSEARLGVLLVPYGDEVVVSTKVGYGIPGVPDWTGPCITAGIERAASIVDAGPLLDEVTTAIADTYARFGWRGRV